MAAAAAATMAAAATTVPPCSAGWVMNKSQQILQQRPLRCSIGLRPIAAKKLSSKTRLTPRSVSDEHSTKHTAPI